MPYQIFRNSNVELPPDLVGKIEDEMKIAKERKSRRSIIDSNVQIHRQSSVLINTESFKHVQDG